MHKRRVWMDDDRYEQLEAQQYDIDGMPYGLLNAILDERNKDEMGRVAYRRVCLVGLGDSSSGDGQWFFLRAPTESEIHARYPELAVVHGRPDWTDRARLDRRIENVLIDIDHVPTGLLRGLLSARDIRSAGRQPPDQSPPEDSTAKDDRA